MFRFFALAATLAVAALIGQQRAEAAVVFAPRAHVNVFRTGLGGRAFFVEPARVNRNFLFVAPQRDVFFAPVRGVGFAVGGYGAGADIVIDPVTGLAVQRSFLFVR